MDPSFWRACVQSDFKVHASEDEAGFLELEYDS